MRSGVFVGAVLAAACGPVVPSTPDASTTEVRASESSASEPGEGVNPGDASGSTTAQAGTTSSTSGDPIPGVCGDGVIGAGEACDDGNAVDDDGCDALCRLPGTTIFNVALDDFHGCPLFALLDDGSLVFASYGQSTQFWSTVQMLGLDADGELLWSYESEPDAGFRSVRALTAIAGGFVSIGAQSTGDEYHFWQETWSSDGERIDEAVLDDVVPFTEVRAIARAPGDSLWMIWDGQFDWTLSLQPLSSPPSWATSLEAPDADIYYSGVRIAADEDGAFVRSATLDVYLQRWSAAGERLWVVPWDGIVDPPPMFSGLVETPDGDAIVVGRVSEAPWIRRYDRNGSLSWAIDVQVGRLPGKDYPRHAQVDVAGDIVAVGEARIPMGYEDAWQAWIAKYDADGQARWQRLFESDPEDPVGSSTFTCGLAVASDRTIYLVGSTNSEGYWLERYTP